MKGYRKTATVLAVLLAVTAMSQTTVYAGSLNANEQELLAYASGTFEYEGHTYKATSAALAMAKAKLCEDDIDVTDSQKAKAYAQVGDYIETAIYNGYLVRTDWGSKEEETETPSTTPTETPAEQPSGNDTTNGTTNDSQNKPSGTEGSTSNGDSNKGPAVSEENTNVTVDGHDKYYTSSDTKQEQQTVTIESYLEGTVSVSNGDSVIFESSLPVKNTGFTIKNSLLTIGALGGLLILTVLESMKFIRFARGKDE